MGNFLFGDGRFLPPPPLKAELKKSEEITSRKLPKPKFIDVEQHLGMKKWGQQ